MLLQDQLLNLSIGEHVSDRRLSASGYAGTVQIKCKPVLIEISADAVGAAADRPRPIVAELELYFSCLVRKQLRFSGIDSLRAVTDDYARVIPGLYATFRAVTTRHCSIVDVGDNPPVETMPVRNPERFVPDWIRIDYRGRQWLGDYGFARKARQPSSPLRSNRRLI